MNKKITVIEKSKGSPKLIDVEDINGTIPEDLIDLVRLFTRDSDLSDKEVYYEDEEVDVDVHKLDKDDNMEEMDIKGFLMDMFGDIFSKEDK